MNYKVETPTSTTATIPAEVEITRRRKQPHDARKSMVARSRPRDERGNFLPKGIAVRIEDLTYQLEDSKSECMRLREELAEREKQLNERDKLLNQLRNRLDSHELDSHDYYEASTSPPHHLSALGPGVRYFTPAAHMYQPHLYGPNARAAFKDKVDLSKITLRKTNSPYVSDGMCWIESTSALFACCFTPILIQSINQSIECCIASLAYLARFGLCLCRSVFVSTFRYSIGHFATVAMGYHARSQWHSSQGRSTHGRASPFSMVFATSRSDPTGCCFAIGRVLTTQQDWQCAFACVCGKGRSCHQGR
jgi:uncharacterized coiled-coil protein SlyX